MVNFIWYLVSDSFCEDASTYRSSPTTYSSSEEAEKSVEVPDNHVLIVLEQNDGVINKDSAKVIGLADDKVGAWVSNELFDKTLNIIELMEEGYSKNDAIAQISNKKPSISEIVNKSNGDLEERALQEMIEF